MDLVVKSGGRSEAYTLVHIIVDPRDGITFECLNKDYRQVIVKPPRVVKEEFVEINPTHCDDSGNFPDALRKGIVK